VTEKVIAANDDDVVVDFVFLQDEMRVADCAEPVRFVSALVVDGGKAEVQIGPVIAVGPLLEMARELCVGNDVRVIYSANGRDVVDDVLEHRLPRDRQKRFGLIQCQWIKPRSVPRREND